MLRVLLGPRWLGLHLLTAVVAVAFVLLGLWQLGRFEDSSSRARARAAANPTPLREVAAPDQALRGRAAGRAVSVAGRYDPDQLLVPGRRLDGRPGLLVVAALRTAQGDVVPVLRGWVARPPAPAPPPGQVSVRGVLEPSETDTDATVDASADLPAGQVAYVGTDVLASALGLDEGSTGLYEGYVSLLEETPPARTSPRLVPVAPHVGGIGRWRNFGYALQWWLFAAAVLALWVRGVWDAVLARRTALSVRS